MNSLEASIKDRTQGIGGSDIHHLFSLKPYGCIRLLWYEKRGIKADYPFLGNNATERGNKLEDIAAQEYMERKKRKVWNKYSAFKHSDWAAGHIDRQIMCDPRGRGVLEIKVPGENMFRKIKREGLPESYILQLQYYLFISGFSWGSYAIFWADGWEMLPFDVERDEKLIGMISGRAKTFWRAFVKGNSEPGRLKETDPRCGKCSYRTTCQGRHLLNTIEGGDEIPYIGELSPLYEEYINAREAVKEAEDHKNSIALKIKEIIGNKPIVKTTGGGFRFKPVISIRWDTKTLEAEHPELAAKYKKQSISRPLTTFSI